MSLHVHCTAFYSPATEALINNNNTNNNSRPYTARKFLSRERERERERVRGEREGEIERDCD